MFVIPSILEEKPASYLLQIKRLSSYFSIFQIDIADGQYVLGKTAEIEETLNIFLKEKNLMKKITFDFHLMIKNYQSTIEKIINFKKKIKLGNIFIHFNLHPNYDRLINLYYKNIGLVINPEDKIEDLNRYYNLNKIKLLQIMSVYPGRQGQPFLRKTLNKITQLRLLGYRYKIYLDGGVNEESLPIILNQRFRPNVICPGSYLVKTNDEELSKKIAYLKQLKIYPL